MSPAAPTGSTPLRQRIVAAATERAARAGWSSVTMAALAADVGVSRQTVYNEIGSKPELAEAVILAELDRFLSVVSSAFDRSPADPLPAIDAAVLGVLEMARGDTLLRAVVSATHGADTELLPLLTTRSSALLSTATAVVRERLAAYAPPIAPDTVGVVADLVVRVVLSHVMQPTGSPEDTAAGIAWAAGRLLSEASPATPAPVVRPASRR